MASRVILETMGLVNGLGSYREKRHKGCILGKATKTEECGKGLRTEVGTRSQHHTAKWRKKSNDKQCQIYIKNR